MKTGGQFSLFDDNETEPTEEKDKTNEYLDRQNIRRWADMAELLVSIDLSSRGIRNTLVRGDDWDIQCLIEEKNLLLNVKATFPRLPSNGCNFMGAGRGSGVGKTASDLRKLTNKIQGFALVYAPRWIGWRDWRIVYFPISQLKSSSIRIPASSFSRPKDDMSWDSMIKEFKEVKYK